MSDDVSTEFGLVPGEYLPLTPETDVVEPASQGHYVRGHGLLLLGRPATGDQLLHNLQWLPSIPTV